MTILLVLNLYICTYQCPTYAFSFLGFLYHTVKLCSPSYHLLNLCSKQVLNGFRLEYCAASDNSTYCPEDFDEFFKQRRRWIPSTIANQWLLVKKWKLVTSENAQITKLFMLYQALLLAATLIGPSVVMLVIAGAYLCETIISH